MKKNSMIMDVQAPKKACEDKNCPFHGNLKVRGKTFTGTVVSDKMQRSVLVQWAGSRFVPKYERYQKTRTKVSAHNPDCVDAKKGDIVKIAECRGLSKTKNFVVLGVVGQETVKEKVKTEGIEEGRQDAPKKEEAPGSKKSEEKGPKVEEAEKEE